MDIAEDEGQLDTIAISLIGGPMAGEVRVAAPEGYTLYMPSVMELNGHNGQYVGFPGMPVYNWMPYTLWHKEDNGK